MEVVHARCAGMDISKTDAKVCVRIAGAGRRKTAETVTTWGAMTGQILALRDHLAAEKVTCVVMEATGDYWKPFYYLLEDLPGVQVMLVNARHVKNLPGRKSDVADATWLAQLGAHGLVAGSFVPSAPIRALRDLTRTRTAITRERGREAQRLEKLLEDAGIKLSSVASDILGVSGRAMLEALIAGQRDPDVLADLARRRLRARIPELAYPGTYLNAKYRRIATRRGPQKANVAIQHAILVAIWNMGTSGTFYEDPGGDYFTRLNPERARTRAIRQLESLGYAVTLAGAS